MLDLIAEDTVYLVYKRVLCTCTVKKCGKNFPRNIFPSLTALNCRKLTVDTRRTGSLVSFKEDEHRFTTSEISSASLTSMDTFLTKLVSSLLLHTFHISNPFSDLSYGWPIQSVLARLGNLSWQFVITNLVGLALYLNFCIHLLN